MGTISGRNKRSQSRTRTAIASTRVFEALESRQLLSGAAMDFAPDLRADTGVQIPLLDNPTVILSAHPLGDAMPAPDEGVQSLSATPVNIPDANLLAAIRSALNKPTGDITDADLAGLTALDGYGRQIADLTGLQYATNLTTLSLTNNRITDLTALRGLTNLTWLYLSNNRIANISPLRSLPQLTGLDLSNNRIANISPLSKLTQLTELDLSYNQIADITPLNNLATAGYLDLSHNRLDLTSGSPASNVIQQLLGLGTTVDFTPQDRSGAAV